MKAITVFCGSSAGIDKDFSAHAFLLGTELAERKIDLIYGGARVGLMGQVADGAISKSGKVVGVLPYFLQDKEIAHEHLSELILVDSMHDRKKRMNDLSDGVIALPGGFGTLEELFEMLTWAQLGLHQKPIAVLNIKGFYNSLMTLLDEMVIQGFLKPVNREMLLVGRNINELLNAMSSYNAPDVDKWMRNEST